MHGSTQGSVTQDGLLQIEDCLDAEGGIVLPPGVTLISLIDRDIANVGDAVAYRYLDFTGSVDGQAVELTWTQLGRRMRAIAARLQRVTSPGDRVAILAPQGLDYVAGFFAAVKAGTIAVPLFAPELPGHAERLEIGARRCTAHRRSSRQRRRPKLFGLPAKLRIRAHDRVITIDDIPDSDGDVFVPVDLDADDISHLQYTSGSTRAAGRRGDHPPRGGHQPAADDPVHRPAGPKHPRCQLVAALPRHGSVDDRLSGGVRRTLDPDVANGVHPSAAALDSGVGGRVAARPCGHRRAELRLRVDRAARLAGARRGSRSQQCRDDHRIRTGQHRMRSRRSTTRLRPTGCRPQRSNLHTGSPRRPCSSRPSRPRRSHGRPPRPRAPCRWSGSTRRGGLPPARSRMCHAVR